MAYFHHRATVRPCKSRSMETGSSGCTSSQLDARQFQAVVPAWYQGHGEEAHLGFPDWRLLRHQLGRWGEHTLGYLHLAILIPLPYHLKPQNYLDDTSFLKRIFY